MEIQDSRIKHRIKKIKHRIADARWRSNVADCYLLLKEVITNKSTWSTENVDNGKISKVKLLNETAEYIRTLESMIIKELDIKVSSHNKSEKRKWNFTKITADFIQLESSSYVNTEAVGPYVEKYLELLAMDEFARSSSPTEVHFMANALEDSKENLNGIFLYYNPENDQTLWRVPKVKYEHRKNTKLIIPSDVKLTAVDSERTPRCSHKRKSSIPQKLPLLIEKGCSSGGQGRPGVKRKLLEEMNYMEDLEDQFDLRYDQNSSEVLGELYGDRNVPEHQRSIIKMSSNENQQVPGSYFENNLAAEVEIFTSENIPKNGAKLKPSKISLQGHKSTKRPWIYTISRKSILKDRTHKSNIQEVPEVTQRNSQDSNHKCYTVLKTIPQVSPKMSNVKLSTICGDSPQEPDSLLTPDDPLFYSADPSQHSSPVYVDSFATDNEDNCLKIYTPPVPHLYSPYGWINDM